MKVAEMAKVMLDAHVSTKQVSKVAVELQDCKAFLNTLEAIEALDIDEYQLEIGNRVYDVSKYEIAEKLKAFTKPRGVFLYSTDVKKCEDLMEHAVDGDAGLLTPADFKEFQRKWFQAYKSSPSFGALDDVKPKGFDSVHVISNGQGMVYCPSANDKSILPVEIADVGRFLKRHAFSNYEDEFVKEATQSICESCRS